MKINGETQLKDLIPEGYEPSGTSGMSLYRGEEHITVSIKKKEVIDFKWYYEKYIELNPYFTQTQIVRLNMIENNFNLVPFEFKIGLLKFICDDLKLNMLDYIHGLYVSRIENIAVTNAVKSICPPEFLNSIFK